MKILCTWLLFIGSSCKMYMRIPVTHIPVMFIVILFISGVGGPCFFGISSRLLECDSDFRSFGTAPLRSGGSFHNVGCQLWWHMPQGLMLCMCNAVIFFPFHLLSHYLTEMVLPNFCFTLCTTASLLYRCHCSLFLSLSLHLSLICRLKFTALPSNEEILHLIHDT